MSCRRAGYRPSPLHAELNSSGQDDGGQNTSRDETLVMALVLAWVLMCVLVLGRMRWEWRASGYRYVTVLAGHEMTLGTTSTEPESRLLQGFSDFLRRFSHPSCHTTLNPPCLTMPPALVAERAPLHPLSPLQPRQKSGKVSDDVDIPR